MATAKGGEKKMITLKSSDGDEFKVEESIAMESLAILHMVEDDGADNGILLRNVKSKILSKVIEYCTKQVEIKTNTSDVASPGASALNASAMTPAAPVEDINSWYAEFINVDQSTLFDIMLAANHLNIKGLLDMTCQTVADMMRDKSPEEIRKTFNMKEDCT